MISDQSLLLSTIVLNDMHTYIYIYIIYICNVYIYTYIYIIYIYIPYSGKNSKNLFSKISKIANHFRKYFFEFL